MENLPPREPYQRFFRELHNKGSTIVLEQGLSFQAQAPEAQQSRQAGADSRRRWVQRVKSNVSMDLQPTQPV